MRLSEMKQVLVERNIRLTKSLGQNFLHDANQLHRIVAAAELKATDRVLEVGPGLGPLTQLLVEQAGEVLAIEKDAQLVEVLKERYRAEPRLRLLQADALEYLGQNSQDWSEWKLVANLPYSVASPILVELAMGRARGDACRPGNEGRGPLRMVATLQIEVAKRLMAGPGTADYGLLTLLVQLDYEPQGWFKIPAGCFFPEPDVDSACVSLWRRPQPLLSATEAANFVRIVKRSFSQRRKMMLKLLKQDWPEPLLRAGFERLPLSPQIRAEQVSLAQFVRLTQSLSVVTP